MALRHDIRVTEYDRDPWALQDERHGDVAVVVEIWEQIHIDVERKPNRTFRVFMPLNFSTTLA